MQTQMHSFNLKHKHYDDKIKHAFVDQLNNTFHLDFFKFLRSSGNVLIQFILKNSPDLIRFDIDLHISNH